MTVGVQAAGGALRGTLNDATTKGSYMPDGSLRITDVAGLGVQDASGALRVSAQASVGVYVTALGCVHYEQSNADGFTGSYRADGALRIQV